MARTVSEIKASITTPFMANEAIAARYGFAVGASFDATFSKVSFESVTFFIIAMAIYTVEVLQDKLKSDVTADLDARLVPGRQFWRDLALSFQYGDPFNEETGKYDVIDETKQIISFAAVEEPSTGGIILKVAKLINGELKPLDYGNELGENPEFTAFSEYIRVAKPAGVKVTIISISGDDLRLVLDIYYDPLVMTTVEADGETKGVLLSDMTTEPVKNTINEFVKSLPFNSEFVLASLVDKLQATAGIDIPTVLSASSKYLTTDWQNIDARVKPYAGYLTITDDNLIINYRPYDVD